MTTRVKALLICAAAAQLAYVQQQYTINGGSISLTPTSPVPPSGQSVRVYGTKLIYDATLVGWAIPAGARNIETWVNGLHYWENTDYTLTTEAGGTVMRKAPAATNMDPAYDVRINYDPPVGMKREREDH